MYCGRQCPFLSSVATTAAKKSPRNTPEFFVLISGTKLDRKNNPVGETLLPIVSAKIDYKLNCIVILRRIKT